MPDVTILPDGLQVTAGDDETLLRALARAGLRYRVGCKRGGCGICKVQLALGEVRYERPIAPQVLSDDERVAGICLSCRAVPLTNVVIELQEGDRLRRVLGFAFPSSGTNSTSNLTGSNSAGSNSAGPNSAHPNSTPPQPPARSGTDPAVRHQGREISR